uniref:Farnesol dehydrogenase n=1 Tax=Epicauta chinensis TaxID=941254 RepID=A0A2R2WS82_9CUCU|nr:farnesol dehydrogenase [Epicauta chinensis]
MDRWRNKVAIVTGASAGIGAAIAAKLVEEGLQVVGLARRVDRIEALSKQLSGKSGKLYAYKTDMTKEDDILNAFKWVTDHVGPVSILINNAGIVQPTDLMNGDTDKWRKTFDTNVLGLCIATREAIKIMQTNNIDGHIVHINSVAGHKIPNAPNLNVYPASKHAVTALTETLRLDLIRIGSKIKISSISPGFVTTEIIEANNIQIDKNRSIPALDAVDVANAVLYVLSTPPNVQVHELIIKPLGEIF